MCVSEGPGQRDSAAHLNANISMGVSHWLVSLLETGLCRPPQLGAEGKTSLGLQDYVTLVMARIVVWSETFTQTVPEVLSD